MSDYQKLTDTDSEMSERCCLPFLFRRRNKRRNTLDQDALFTHERIKNKAREIRLLSQGVHFEMTELTVEAQNHMDSKDRDMVVSCVQRRHALKKRYVRLVRMYTNAELMAINLVDASVYRKFSLALKQSNQSLESVLVHLNYEDIEDVMDKLEDNQAEVEQLGDLLSRDTAIDHVTALDIEAEIRQLEQEQNLMETDQLPDVSRLGLENTQKQTLNNGGTSSTSSTETAGFQ